MQNPAGGGGDKSDPTVEAPPAGAVAQVAASPLRRLTAVEYSHTLRDLLGDDSAPGDAFGEDLAGDSGFAQPGSVSGLEAARFAEAAESAAARATKALPKLLGCDPAAEGCARGWVLRFARRAYRRPLDTEEQARLTAYYDDVRAGAGQTVEGAVRVVLATVLQSPHFLYRWELGARPAVARDGVVALNHHEMASRLSYFLWESMPDDELASAADASRLGSPAALAEQARRMLKSPKARDTIASFHEQWLGLLKIARVEKDTTAYPAFDDAVRAAMQGEMRAFIDHVFFTGDGRADTLFGAGFSFVNAPLAKIYGLSNVTGADLRRVDLDVNQRAGGILTQLGFLSAHAQPSESSPIKRGVTLRQKVLCQDIPSPSQMMFESPAPDPNVSVRDQFAQHSADPACRTCHKLIDPLGFGLESFDGIGRYRTKQAGKDVDTSGVLVGVGPSDVPFANGRDMLKTLRASAELNQCLAKQWLRFGLRRATSGADAASLDEAFGAFERSGGDLRELVVAVVSTPAFRFRKPSPGEVVQ